MSTAESRLEAINTAIRRGNGIVAFANSLGVSHQAVTGWRKACQVPLARAFEINKLYAVPAVDTMPPEDAANILEAAGAADLL